MKISRANIEVIFLFLGVIFYLLVFPHGIHGDGFVRFDGLQNLLKTGAPAPMLYSYIGPLLSAPLMLLGKIFKDEYWWLSRFNTFLYLGLMVFVYKRIAKDFSVAGARRFLLLMMIATMFPRHITDYYGEVFSTVLMVMAMWWMTEKSSWKAILAGALSIGNTPGTLVGGAFATLPTIWQQRKLRYGLLIVFAFLLIVFESYWKLGSFFPSSYISTSGYKNALPYSGIPGFSYPLFFGVLSVLFSFGKGLIFFAPGLLALFIANPLESLQWKNLRRQGIFYLVGLILVYSRWWCWTGDWFWGPRFYLYSSFLALMGIFSLWTKPSRTLTQNIFLLSLITLSVWVSAQGIAFGTDDLEYCGIEGGKMFFMCYYTPEFSALWRAFVVEGRTVNGKQLAFFIFHALGYIILTSSLWTEIFRQAKQPLKDFWIRATVFREWKW